MILLITRAASSAAHCSHQCAFTGRVVRSPYVWFGSNFGIQPCAALCLASTTSGHIDGAVRPGAGGRRYSRPTQRREGPGHPCSMTNECAWRCSNLCTTAERGADGVRRRLRHDQYIPSGLNRSTVLRSCFAKVSGKTSGDLECRSTEPGGQKSRHKLDRGP